MKKHWFFLVFISFYTILVSSKLIFSPSPFYDWDEPLYVQGGIEMLRSRYFLLPVWLGRPWFDKPPLSSLVYGLTTLLPLEPEVSTRLLALTTTIVILSLMYVLYRRVSKSSTIATLSAVATAFGIIFIQRAQVVNLDVFLLMGWLGYLVFIRKPVIAALFLLCSVQSKSLLGFYPLVIYLLVSGVELLRKEIKFQEVKKRIAIVVLQGLFLSTWYIVMLGLYGKTFWQAHIIESHFMRVNASIESHFGQRTFYIDLLIQQLQWLIFPALLSVGLLLYEWITKKRSTISFALATWFIPWFLFLNLTKTKISWYLYPVIPQFFFLAMYPLILLRKWKRIFIFTSIVITIFLLYQGIFVRSFVTTHYSKWEDYHQLAKDARKTCRNLGVLVSLDTQSTYSELKRMGLTIQTTDWWGDHPSMVYYFDKPMDFFYSIQEMKQKEKQYQCFVVSKNSTYIPKKTILKKEYGSMQLLIHNND